MKRRAAIVGLLVAGFAAGGTAVAQAATPGLSAARDSSGCVVLLPDAANPITICLFPR